jgi:hypothetical protein
MDRDQFLKKKSEIDDALAKAPERVGILLGSELYEAFKVEGCLHKEALCALGEKIADVEYYNDHHVGAMDTLGPWGYKIGEKA